jgi:hypothetical protein
MAVVDPSTGRCDGSGIHTGEAREGGPTSFDDKPSEIIMQ